MSIGGEDAKLSLAPWLIPKPFAHLRTRVANRGIIRINIVDVEISEVRVVAKPGRMNRVRAFAGHNPAVAGNEEKPARSAEALDGESKNVPVKGCG
jgi:hypothetical protein